MKTRPPCPPSHPSPLIPPPTVTAQIMSLSSLPFPEIKALWRKLFKGEAPTHNRQFLERRMAYRLQEIEFRKVDPGMLERNSKKIASLIATGKLRKRDLAVQPTPGTVFNREYQGKPHQVTALADGQYEFEGRPYRSLSAIAREITGIRWSGPTFFGLTTAVVKARIPSSTRTSTQAPPKISLQPRVKKAAHHE